jgi:hypothetical protein
MAPQDHPTDPARTGPQDHPTPPKPVGVWAEASVPPLRPRWWALIALAVALIIGVTVANMSSGSPPEQPVKRVPDPWSPRSDGSVGCP